MRQYLKTAVLAGVAAVLFVGILVVPGQAQSDGSGDGQYKIAVADLKVLLKDYSKRKEMYDELQAEVDRRQKEIDALSEKIQKAKDAFEASADTMGDQERLEKETGIESDYIKYQGKMKEHQNYIDKQEEQVLRTVVADIQAAIERVGQQENYHLILNSAKGPQGSVLYHSATIDITSKVLASLEAQKN